MGKIYFGYKNHIKADSKTKLITGYNAITANIHDSEVIDKYKATKNIAATLFMLPVLIAVKPFNK